MINLLILLAGAVVLLLSVGLWIVLLVRLRGEVSRREAAA